MEDHDWGDRLRKKVEALKAELLERVSHVAVRYDFHNGFNFLQADGPQVDQDEGERPDPGQAETPRRAETEAQTRAKEKTADEPISEAVASRRKLEALVAAYSPSESHVEVGGFVAQWMSHMAVEADQVAAQIRANEEARSGPHGDFQTERAGAARPLLQPAERPDWPPTEVEIHSWPAKQPPSWPESTPMMASRSHAGLRAMSARSREERPGRIFKPIEQYDWHAPPFEDPRIHAGRNPRMPAEPRESPPVDPMKGYRLEERIKALEISVARSRKASRKLRDQVARLCSEVDGRKSSIEEIRLEIRKDVEEAMSEV